MAFLGVLVVVNVLLVASIPLRTRRRRQSARQVHVQSGSPAGLTGRADPRTAEDAREVAAIEAFVTGVSANAHDRSRPPAPPSAMAGRREAVIGAAADRTVVPLRATEGPTADHRAPWTIPDLAQPSITPEWTLADLADPATWSRSIREESARVARFGHPVTVVIAELPRLDALADRFGRGVADRVVTEAARLLVSESRAADRIAWLGDARFGVLLLETEEIAAGGYVERVRAAANGWLESTGLSIRISLGWASPAEGGDVTGAAVAAEQRMHDADRGSMPERSPRVASRKPRPSSL